MFIQGHHLSTPLTDQSAQNTQQHRRESAISHLYLQKAQHYLQKTMDKKIQNVANGPSSSNNSLLQNLLALKSRGYQKAAGSTIVLSYSGLPGGGKRVDIASSFSSSSATNNYQRYTDQQLMFILEETADMARQLQREINQMPEGPQKRQMVERRNSVLNRRQEASNEIYRRDDSIPGNL